MNIKDVLKEVPRQDRSKLSAYYIQEHIRKKYGFSFSIQVINDILDFYEDFLDILLGLSDIDEIDEKIMEAFKNEIRQKEH